MFEMNDNLKSILKRMASARPNEPVLPTDADIAAMSDAEKLQLQESIQRGYKNTSIGGRIGDAGRYAENMGYNMASYAPDSLAARAATTATGLIAKGTKFLAGKAAKKYGIDLSSRLKYKSVPTSLKSAPVKGTGSEVGSAMDGLKQVISTERTQASSDKTLDKIADTLSDMKKTISTEKQQYRVLESLGLIQKSQEEMSKSVKSIEDLFIEKELDVLEQKKEFESSPETGTVKTVRQLPDNAMPDSKAFDSGKEDNSTIKEKITKSRAAMKAIQGGGRAAGMAARAVGAGAMALGTTGIATVAGLGALGAGAYAVNKRLSEGVASEEVSSSIDSAAKKVGVDRAQMYAIARRESEFDAKANNKTGSSGKGLFQFLDKTWQGMLDNNKNNPEVLNVLKKGPLDPQANALAGALLMKDNERSLKRDGLSTTTENMYMMHHLPPQTAKKLIKAAPETRMQDIVTPLEMEQNPIFKDKTASQIKAELFNPVAKDASQLDRMFKAGMTGTQATSINPNSVKNTTPVRSLTENTSVFNAETKTVEQVKTEQKAVPVSPAAKAPAKKVAAPVQAAKIVTNPVTEKVSNLSVQNVTNQPTVQSVTPEKKVVPVLQTGLTDRASAFAMPAEQKQVQAVTPNRGNAAAALQVADDQLAKAKTVSQKPAVIAVPSGGKSPAPKGGSASPISAPMAPRVPSPARRAQEKDFKI